MQLNAETKDYFFIYIFQKNKNMKDPLFRKSHPFTKIIFLSFIGIVSISILFIFTLFLSKDDIGSLKILTAIQHILLFITPPFIAAYLYSSNTKTYLFLNKPKTIFIGFTILIIVFAIPIINYTGVINANLKLPESFSGLEKIMKEMEASAKVLTEKILKVNSFGGLLMNLFIIALLPAIGEELIFRGILLRLFKEWFKNMHVAIIVSAFTFSFIHFQFYGFIPRMLLGIVFGYLLYWSGSILMPMLAHFINNAFAVIAFYYMTDTAILEKTESFGAESSTYIYLLISSVLFIFVFYLFKKERVKNFI